MHIRLEISTKNGNQEISHLRDSELVNRQTMDSYTTKELLLASLIHISKSIETLTISIEVKK